jgi:hypothetical protein
MYNIPDPLEGTSQSNKITVRASRRTQSGTPSLKKKSSASSFKDKMIKHRDIDLQQFHSNRKIDLESEADISLLTARKTRGET